MGMQWETSTVEERPPIQKKKNNLYVNKTQLFLVFSFILSIINTIE